MFLKQIEPFQSLIRHLFLTVLRKVGGSIDEIRVTHNPCLKKPECKLRPHTQSLLTESSNARKETCSDLSKVAQEETHTSSCVFRKSFTDEATMKDN